MPCQLDALLQYTMNADQHSTAQHSTAQHGLALCITAWLGLAQHSTAWHKAAQRIAAQHRTAWHKAAQHSTTQQICALQGTAHQTHLKTLRSYTPLCAQPGRTTQQDAVQYLVNIGWSSNRNTRHSCRNTVPRVKTLICRASEMSISM